jgi:hypothetical protein
MMSDAGGQCERQAEEERAFVAAHRACGVDADCVAVGDCGNSDFIAVSASAMDEAKALIERRCFNHSDGPGYYALCRNSLCERVQSTRYCTEVPHTPVCPAGSSYERLGCGGEFDGEGCYMRCDPSSPEPCAPGFRCAQVAVNPDSDPDGGLDDTCGTTRYLCQESPDCQLELGLSLDWLEVAELKRDMGAELRLTVRNRSDAPLTFSYDAPCHGPKVSGLGDYELWESCLAGACEHEFERVTLTLAAGETHDLASDVILAGPATCNPQGLAEGSYRLSFELPNLAGAIACGPSPVELRVVPGRAHGL